MFSSRRMRGSIKNTLEISSSTSWKTFLMELGTHRNIKRRLILKGEDYEGSVRNIIIHIKWEVKKKEFEVVL